MPASVRAWRRADKTIQHITGIDDRSGTFRQHTPPAPCCARQGRGTSAAVSVPDEMADLHRTRRCRAVDPRSPRDKDGVFDGLTWGISNVSQLVDRCATLAEIKEKLAHISEVWRSDTTSEQGVDLVDLDDCLAELEEMEPETAAEDEVIEELRGRIEILMDEIEIKLGLEPPGIIPPEDYDTET